MTGHMHVPIPEADPIADLRESLLWAVPLRSVELLHQYSEAELERFLPGMVRRGGQALGEFGDVLMFKGDRPSTKIAAWRHIVDGVTAMAMLGGRDGVTIPQLGLHLCPQTPCPHPKPWDDGGEVAA